MKDLLADEIKRELGRYAEILPGSEETALHVVYSGPLASLLDLRIAVAVYLVTSVPGRRPTTLLGDTRLFEQAKIVRDLHPHHTFSSFRLSVPGKESAAVRRIREELAERTKLGCDPDYGELFLRIRRSRVLPNGWDVLTRLSPRPLSTRAWRVHNLPGALNATIAAGMIDLSNPRPDDRVLNVMCGSGTLLIERLLRAPAALATGCDIARSILDGARANLAAARLNGLASLTCMDVRALGFGDASFNVLLSDLPYGHRMGTHEDNRELYSGVLAEAARVTAAKGIFVAVTHELRIFQRCLQDASHWWSLEKTLQVYQKGHHPVIYVLRRTDARAPSSAAPKP